MTYRNFSCQMCITDAFDEASEVRSVTEEETGGETRFEDINCGHVARDNVTILP